MEIPFEVILEKLNTIENLIKFSGKCDLVLAPQESEILNFKQAIDYLGYSKSYMYKLTSGRIVPHYKNGKMIYFKKNELYEWITKNRVKTYEEIEVEANTYIATRRKY